MNFFHPKIKPVKSLDPPHEKMSRREQVDEFCMESAPFVIIVMVLILIVSMLVCFSHSFATEANLYYYHLGA